MTNDDLRLPLGPHGLARRNAFGTSARELERCKNEEDEKLCAVLQESDRSDLRLNGADIATNACMASE